MTLPELKTAPQVLIITAMFLFCLFPAMSNGEENETGFEIYILVLCFWGDWFNGSDDKTSNQYRTTKQNHI